MENMERFAHYTCHLERLEILHFDKEGYLRVFIFYGLFYKINRKHPPLMFPDVVETFVEILEDYEKYLRHAGTNSQCLVRELVPWIHQLILRHMPAAAHRLWEVVFEGLDSLF